MLQLRSDTAPGQAGPATGAQRGGLRHRLTLALCNYEVLKKLRRWPVFSYFAGRDAARLFDVVAGFTHSQILFACVELQIFERLKQGPKPVAALAQETGIDAENLLLLCRGAVALGLLRQDRQQRFALARLGAASLAVPGLTEMIRHHDRLYRDLADPVALLAGQRDQTELSDFWAYVHSPEGQSAATYARYSRLMAESQRAVAEETLQHIDMSGCRALVDVGGGQGVFARAVKAAFPSLTVAFFDLPEVVEGHGSSEVAALSGNFKADPLPGGFDALSFVRIFFDHGDETVLALLRKAHAALPEGGRLIVSEPMLGGGVPSRAGDCYYALYTLAMKTGKTRSPEHIAALLRETGFGSIRIPRSGAPETTQVVTAVRQTVQID